MHKFKIIATINQEEIKEIIKADDGNAAIRYICDKYKNDKITAVTAIKMYPEWHSINMDLYNPYLSFEANIENGVELPPEWKPVLVCNTDKPCYFVGSFFMEDNKLCCSTPQYTYHNVQYFRWYDFPSCPEVSEDD